MNELLSKTQFQEKWDSMLMSSSEFWWYAGTNDNLHFIAIETPLNTSIYSVADSTVKFKNIKLKEFSESKENWVIIKTENIEFLK